MAELTGSTAALAQCRHAILGLRVQGAAKVVPQNATQTVFTITGGRIMVQLLYGLVTVVIAGTTPAAKYVATPTVGTANDMDTTGTITGAEVGSMFVLPLAKASALVVSTASSGSQTGVGLGGQIIAPGTVGFNVSAADATGSVQHTLYYVALDDAARVVAN